MLRMISGWVMRSSSASASGSSKHDSGKAGSVDRTADHDLGPPLRDIVGRRPTPLE